VFRLTSKVRRSTTAKRGVRRVCERPCVGLSIRKSTQLCALEIIAVVDFLLSVVTSIRTRLQRTITSPFQMDALPCSMLWETSSRIQAMVFSSPNHVTSRLIQTLGFWVGKLCLFPYWLPGVEISHLIALKINIDGKLARPPYLSPPTTSTIFLQT
jgi:hypothetical protein